MVWELKVLEPDSNVRNLIKVDKSIEKDIIQKILFQINMQTDVVLTLPFMQ